MSNAGSVSPVAIHVPYLGGGGVERGMANLADELVRRGVRVDIVVSDGSKNVYGHDLDKRVNFFELNVSRHLFGLIPLARYLKRERPRVLITAMPPSHPLALLARVLANVDTVCVAGVHSFHSKEYEIGDGPSLPRRFVLALFPLILRQMDRVFAVSRHVKEDLVQSFNLPPTQVDVVYNPVAIPQVKEKASKEISHPWFDENRPVLLAVGRLVEEKNYSLLLKAFGKVLRNRPARLLILGEGKKRSLLEKKAKQLEIRDAVSMPGFVNNPFSYMRQADLFVLSSIQEGLPSVLVEALAVGCNVVATDCRSGPREILEEGKYGRLVPVNDGEALARSILEALDEGYLTDPTDLRQRAAEFSARTVADRYINLLSD